MTWQEYAAAIHRPDNPTRVEWDAAVAKARKLLEQVSAQDRGKAESILRDVFFEWPPEGIGLDEPAT